MHSKVDPRPALNVTARKIESDVRVIACDSEGERDEKGKGPMATSRSR